MNKINRTRIGSGLALAAIATGLAVGGGVGAASAAETQAAKPCPKEQARTFESYLKVNPSAAAPAADILKPTNTELVASTVQLTGSELVTPVHL